LSESFNVTYVTPLPVALTFVLIVGVGYLLGSLPTAYLLVKWKANLDIREMGTGNVGALNSYEVTRSKFVGLAVLLIDLAKGGLAVGLTRAFIGTSFWMPALAAISVIVGHNYPVWLGFKGGRGLAPAAGALLLVNWALVVLWSLIWLVTFALTRNVHKGNIIAILVTPFVATMLAGSMVGSGIVEDDSRGLFILFTFFFCLLLFLRHLQPLREQFLKKSQ
jgi:glycerol-3-phosphate acyltransferase PlsY